jgi:hypothetical protein
VSKLGGLKAVFTLLPKPALHDADAAIAAGGGSNTDLGLTITRITSAPALRIC